MRNKGFVWLVGAGPGDPELLTVKAVRALSNADVVAYDELISDEILALAPAHAERIPVGRRANGCRYHDDKIHPAVIERALEGKTVVRLKGGDPMIFGRGGEEAEEIAAAGIDFQIVPGISAALGAAAATGIPLTHREEASSVTFATAHAAKGDGDPKLAVTVPITGTVVLYMGLGRLADTASSLINAGRVPSTPVAVIAHATRPTQRLVIGTLETIADDVARANLPAPALIVVGDVVSRAATPAALLAAVG
jgi:uroporphyrin-III C-methyltransferase / precorrin-2 dehydrogenase / sirohydrochlorin ferrochelatase